MGGDLLHRSPHNPGGEDAVGRAPGRDSGPEVAGVAEGAVGRVRDAPAGGELPLVLTAEPGLRIAGDPRGIQQPAQQRTPRPRGGADQVRASPLGIRGRRRGHGAIEARPWAVQQRDNQVDLLGALQDVDRSQRRPSVKNGPIQQGRLAEARQQRLARLGGRNTCVAQDDCRWLRLTGERQTRTTTTEKGLSGAVRTPTLHNAHYRRMGSGPGRGCAPFVPSHGRCRISLILSVVMSTGNPSDMNLRQAPMATSRWSGPT